MRIYIDGFIYSLQKNGGVTRYTDELIAGFAGLGHSVTVFIYPHALNQPRPDKNIELIYIKPKFKLKIPLIKYINYYFSMNWMNNYFKNNNVTNAVFHSTYLIQYKNLNIPKVITIHDLTREKFPNSFKSLKNKLAIFITKRSIRNSNAVICYSIQTKKELIEYYNIAGSKVTVIPLGVNSLFCQKSLDEKEAFKESKKIFKPFLLYVGTRAEYKNFGKLLLAFSLWKRRNNFLLVLVGSEELNSEELNLVGRLHLEGNIIYFGKATEEELIMLYNCTAALVFPSLSEGFGLPLLEAMACGAPVAVSDIPVFKEVAEDVPYYFDPNSVNDIIRALDDSLQIDASRQTKGLELASKFTWQNTIQETLRIYEEIS